MRDRLVERDPRARSLHCVIGGVALHEKFGFKKVTHFRQVSRKFDRSIDVGYWELML
jgi:L-amino acid N-acyltransferase YncA